MLIDTGVGERLQREAMVHDGIYISFKGEARHIDFHKLIGKQVFIYDQKEVVTDLIAKRLADGGQIYFEVEGASVHDFSGDKPRIRFRHQARRRRSNATSSAVATASTASAGRVFRLDHSKITTASIRSAGSASSRNRRRRTKS